MDLDALDTRTAAETGVRMPLRHPVTDEPLMQADGTTPVTLTLLGQDSKVYRGAMAAVSDRRLARQAERRGSAPMTSAGLEEDGRSVVVACVIRWDGIRWDGQDQSCTTENVREMFRRWSWAQEQAEAFVARRANFLPDATAA